MIMSLENYYNYLLDILYFNGKVNFILIIPIAALKEESNVVYYYLVSSSLVMYFKNIKFKSSEI